MMSQELLQLQDDIDLSIWSKIADLKGTLFSLQLQNENLDIEVVRTGSNGTYQHLMDLQGVGQAIGQLCEEVLTLISVMKRIRVHSGGVPLTISSLQSKS